jgi:hypothetical protein
MLEGGSILLHFHSVLHDFFQISIFNVNKWYSVQLKPWPSSIVEPTPGLTSFTPCLVGLWSHHSQPPPELSHLELFHCLMLLYLRPWGQSLCLPQQCLTHTVTYSSRPYTCGTDFSEVPLSCAPPLLRNVAVGASSRSPRSMSILVSNGAERTRQGSPGSGVSTQGSHAFAPSLQLREAGSAINLPTLEIKGLGVEWRDEMTCWQSQGLKEWESWFKLWQTPNFTTS